MKNLKNLFLNEKFILSIILLNAVVIFLQSFNMDNILHVDFYCGNGNKTCCPRSKELLEVKMEPTGRHFGYPVYSFHYCLSFPHFDDGSFVSDDFKIVTFPSFSQSTAFLSQYRTDYQRFQAGDQRILCHTALLSAVNRLVRPHQLQPVQRYGTNVLRNST